MADGGTAAFRAARDQQIPWQVEDKRGRAWAGRRIEAEPGRTRHCSRPATRTRLAEAYVFSRVTRLLSCGVRPG